MHFGEILVEEGLDNRGASSCAPQSLTQHIAPKLSLSSHKGQWLPALHLLLLIPSQGCMAMPFAVPLHLPTLLPGAHAQAVLPRPGEVGEHSNICTVVNFRIIKIRSGFHCVPGQCAGYHPQTRGVDRVLRAVLCCLFA